MKKRGAARSHVSESRDLVPEIFLTEYGGARVVSRLKWIVSTCIVGAAGFCIIGIVMYASMNIEDGSGMVGSIRRASIAALQPQEAGHIVAERLATLGHKTDRIKTTTKGLTTRHIIHDRVVENQVSGEFIRVKPYARIVASLATVETQQTDAIPPFNPFELYENKEPIAESIEQGEGSPQIAPNEQVETRLIDLAGGFLPDEDGQELPVEEIERLVAEADAVYAESAANLKPAILPEGGSEATDDEGLGQGGPVLAAGEDLTVLPPRTSVIEKTEDEEAEIDERAEVVAVTVRRGDTLLSLIRDADVPDWQANAVADAVTSVEAGKQLRPGQELRFTVVPAVDNPAQNDPLRVSLYTGVKHEVTVVRNEAGEYVAQDEPVGITAALLRQDSSGPRRADVYTSMYQAALAQDCPPELISKLLRIHSYDVDYKQRVRPGDGFELFFDLKKDDKGAELPGELLYAAMTVGDETTRYYRFRTPDGAIDYYNDRGSNSRKFMIRKPVKNGRFTSSFGYRRHPLLGIRRMHNGVDWAAPTGTPILAAGNGVVEIAGRHGGYGNYIRIRHGNGYKSAYGHMSRFAEGVKKGIKVRQGQVIGYVGSTGLSSGPHLHYEVLVNNRHVNPMSIQVPRSRQLEGRLLADFKKEQSRIDELMRRAPVTTRVAAVSE